jgi:hypothetical protein
MNIIFADFNAMTEDDHVCLTTRGSQEDMQRSNVRVGDWVWLGDGELIVGAQVAEDPIWGLIGIPAWNTLVHLDDEGADDPVRIDSELQSLLQREVSAERDETRIFQLLTQLDHLDPPLASKAIPGFRELKRADTLLAMNNPGLALLELGDARLLIGDDPNLELVYLESLRRAAPDRAVLEASRHASSTATPAVTLVASINILASHAEELSGGEFETIANRTLHCYEQFERAPGRSEISASLLSLVHFNRGLLLLRMGRDVEARRALELAHLIDPLNPSLDEATQLVAYDQHAREIGSRVRSRRFAA